MIGRSEKESWSEDPFAAYREAERRIESARRDNAPVLKLSDLAALDRLPQEIAELSNLENLISFHTQVADLSPLAGLANLQRLDFSNTPIADLTPLSGHNKLYRLSIPGTKVTNLTHLAGLFALQRLSLSDTQVSDLTPLAKLENLQFLNLSHTHVANLTPLTGLVKLQNLYFPDTHVADLTPLAGLSDLIVGANNSGGLDFRDCPNITDPTLIKLSKMPNPERTVETLRHLRELKQKQESKPKANFQSQYTVKVPLFPEPPAQSPAPLQVVFVGGILKALPPPSPELASADATQRAQEAYDALKEMADAIHGSLSGGNYPHVTQSMAAYCRALGSDFQNLRQIALGMHGERLKAQAATAHEFMPDVLAADLKGLAAAHAMFLQHFEDWQAFLDDVKKSPLDPAKAEAARSDARGIITELQGQANIDEEVILSLREQESALNDGGTHDQVRSQGFYRSLDKVLFALFGAVMNFVDDVRKDLRPRAVSLTSGAIVSTPVAMLVDHLCGTRFLSPLASHLSEVFPWLLPAIDCWTHRHKE